MFLELLLKRLSDGLAPTGFGHYCHMENSGILSLQLRSMFTVHTSHVDL